VACKGINDIQIRKSTFALDKKLKMYWSYPINKTVNQAPVINFPVFNTDSSQQSLAINAYYQCINMYKGGHLFYPPLASSRCQVLTFQLDVMVFCFSNTFVLGRSYVHHRLGRLISQLMMYWSYPIKDNHSFVFSRFLWLWHRSHWIN
jgi:hypothetical protein